MDYVLFLLGTESKVPGSQGSSDEDCQTEKAAFPFSLEPCKVDAGFRAKANPKTMSLPLREGLGGAEGGT